MAIRALSSTEFSASAARPHVMHVVTAAITTRLMRGQLRHLREAGFEVTLVSSPGPDLDSVAAAEGVDKVAVPMEREIAPLQDLRSLWLLWRLMRRARPAVVNVGTAKAGLLAGIAARLAGVPCCVYTLHGLRLETTTGLKRAILMAAERIACRCAHRVLCVSRSVRTRAVELALVDRDRCCLLGSGSFNGVDVERFAPTSARRAEAAALRGQLGIPSEAPVIGFVGRFTRDKGMPELVEAFRDVRKALPDARLLLLGRFESGDPVPGEVRSFLETHPAVVHVGFVSDPSVYYHVMDVLALPTYREGFPTVVLEAAAAEKPVVSTHATGARDAVVDGVTGLLVPVGDSRALSAALLAVLTDRPRALGMGAAGRRRAQEQYAPQRVCSELTRLYQSMLVESGLPEARQAGTCAAAHSTHPAWSALALKRTLDVCAALTGLAVAGPLMAAAVVAIRVTMGSPVLFRQRRAGRHGRPFSLLKFRTMTDARGPQGQLLPDTARLSRTGRLLRRFSVDELPQLWNVLKGEMSIVGPRPLLVEYLPGYTEREDLRHAVRPGLTGHSQISGRHTLLFSKRLALDAWYVENWSIGLDIRILGRTVPKVLCPSDSVVCQDYPAVDDRGFWRYLQEPRSDREAAPKPARAEGAI